MVIALVTRVEKLGLGGYFLIDHCGLDHGRMGKFLPMEGQVGWHADLGGGNGPFGLKGRLGSGQVQMGLWIVIFIS